jgi:plastocyanin
MKAIALVLAALATLVACGGSGGGSGGGAQAGTKVTLTEYKFDPKDLTVPSGKVTFTLVNAGTTGHDMTVADQSGKILGKSEIVQAGDSKEFTIDNLPAGTYAIYCDLPGHRASGMQGTLTAT